MVVRQSGETVLDVWSFMARELPYALEPTPPPADFAPGITGPSSESMVQVDLERPKSLPPVPQSGEIAPPPVAYGGYRDPLTFSSVSSLLNPVPRQNEAPKTYQLYDAPIPVARLPVQRAFERVSGTGSGGFGVGTESISVSGYYAPTPVYERFARGGKDAPSPLRSTPSPPIMPARPRRKEGDFVPWHAKEEQEVPIMSNNQHLPDISQLSLQNSSPPRSIGRFEQHANTFDGVRVSAAAYHYSTSPPTQNLGVGAPGMQNATIATSPLKGKPSRAGLPLASRRVDVLARFIQAWLEQGGMAPDERSFSPPQTSDISSGGTSPPHHHLQTPQSMGMSASMSNMASPVDDEIIPTAIVIKNIPFTVKRETLLDIISSLSIPTPYAFNYHLDTQGQFRGLAFANFRLPADADAVVAALNGFDVQGRKLRVEYKKVLQAGEKERIEREKAIRRMRSMQMEKERSQLLPSASAGNNEWDDYGTPTGGGAYLSPSRTYSTGQVGLSQQLQQLPVMHSPPPPPAAQMPTPTPSQQSAKSASTELDMNDPSTLEIYSRILVFKEDHMRDELAFSRSLSPKQRRVVHLVAQKLGVYHYSVGEGENRYAVVTRIERENRTPITRHASQTLSRAATSYLVPSPTAPSLRVKKSMPDMKSLHTPTASRLQPRASNGNIREGFATISAALPRRTSVATTFGNMFGSGGMGSAGGVSETRGYGGVGMGVPPVPSLPPGADNGLGGSNAGQSGVMRQPRGPGAGGFARRATGERLEARSHEPLEL
ncbi:hypothetical protein FRC10_004625 [Ceratobasidium sp. 414]|nr:hypothetical protein FRC10_004625 [Ceratobasidium sp. 414]